jgi:hypothetical protein
MAALLTRRLADLTGSQTSNANGDPNWLITCFEGKKIGGRD